LACWKISGTINELAGIFARRATRQRVAFSFVRDGGKPKPNRFELSRHIDKWTEAIPSQTKVAGVKTRFNEMEQTFRAMSGVKMDSKRLTDYLANTL
jgi:hypothetical protein